MKQYEKMKIAIQEFSQEDVITTSVTGGTATEEEGTQVDPFSWYTWGGN